MSVKLTSPQKEQTLHAQVQWCHGNEIGVGFATRAWDEGGDALAGRVGRLEAEVAALRRLLKRMKMELADRAETAA